MLKTGYPASRCHTVDGRGFWCDTDFHQGTPTTLEDIVRDTWEERLCVTGGEPLLHKEKLDYLVALATANDLYVHIETSGTVDWEPAYPVYLTVSPKSGCLETMVRRADEIKLLVDDEFKLDNIPSMIKGHHMVFIQPINNETSLNMHNVELCKQILRTMPGWQLSLQIHKILGIQ
jgi:organic radical activating enzyme